MRWPRKCCSWCVRLTFIFLLSHPLSSQVSRNEALADRLATLERIEQEHTALEGRYVLRRLWIPQSQISISLFPNSYQHILVMYGEKAEEAQELKLDLADVRTTYQLQIQQLAARVEELQQQRR